MVTSAVFLTSFIVNNHTVDIYDEFLHGRRLHSDHNISTIMKDSRIFCEQNSISSTIELFRGRRTIPCLIFRFPQQLLNYFWTVQVCML